MIRSFFCAGLGVPPRRRVPVEHGAAGIVRAGGDLEGCWRRRRAAGPCAHALQLDLHLTLLLSFRPHHFHQMVTVSYLLRSLLACIAPVCMLCVL